MVAAVEGDPGDLEVVPAGEVVAAAAAVIVGVLGVLVADSLVDLVRSYVTPLAQVDRGDFFRGGHAIDGGDANLPCSFAHSLAAEVVCELRKILIA